MMSYMILKPSVVSFLHMTTYYSSDISNKTLFEDGWLLYCGYTIYCIILLFGKSLPISLQISHIRLSFRMVDCEIAGASSSSLASLVIWIPFLMQLSCVNLGAWSVSDIQIQRYQPQARTMEYMLSSILPNSKSQ